jgi:hypothetical protein
MKVRCDSCKSVFYEEFLVNKACPCCGVSECITELPKKDFPQYYEKIQKEDETMKKYTLKEYKDFSSEALACPPFEEFEDGTSNEEDWFDAHQIKIVVGDKEMELPYYADVINELDWALREMYEEEYCNGEPTTGNTVGSEYRPATLKDLVKVALREGWGRYGYKMSGFDAYIKCFIEEHENIEDIVHCYEWINTDIKGYTEEYKCNFGQLDMNSMKNVSSETVKHIIDELICTDMELLVGYDNELRCSDITFVMDYTIKPSGELIGWFYGEADDDYIGQLIADYKKKLFKED